MLSFMEEKAPPRKFFGKTVSWNPLDSLLYTEYLSKKGKRRRKIMFIFLIISIIMISLIIIL
jgi:hypothetical protein